MTYAFLTEGLEPDKRAEVDEALNVDPEKLKARRERETLARVMGGMVPGA